MAEKAKITLTADDETGPAFASAKRNVVSLQKELQRATFKNQQLGFQLNDFFVQVAGGQGVLLPLIQQGSQLVGTFGSVGGAFKAVTDLITPARLGIAGLAAAAAALVLTFRQGAVESKALRDNITLTGNAAGQTEGQFNQQAAGTSASSKTLTVGETKEAGRALIATGQIGPENFAAAQEAAARFAKATNQTAEDVAKDFATMSTDAAKWASDHSRSLSFVTLAQFLQIKALHEAGREVEAQKIVYDALNDRFRALEGNLSDVDRVLQSARQSFSAFWNAAKEGAGAKTVEGELAAVERQIREAEQLQKAAPGITGADLGAFTGKPAIVGRDTSALKARQSDQLLAQQAEGEKALAQAADDRKNKEAISAVAVVDGLLKQAKAGTALNQEITKATAAFKALEAAGKPVSAADKKTIVDDINRRFSTVSFGQQAGDLEKQLQTRTQKIGQTLANEQDLLKFNQQFVDALLRDGNVSLEAAFHTQDELRRRNLEEIKRAATDVIAAEKDFQAKLPAAKSPAEGVERDKTITDSENRIQAARARLAAGKREFQQGTDLAAAVRPEERTKLKQQVDDFNAAVDDLISGGRTRAAEFAGIAAQTHAAQKLLIEGGASRSDAKAQTDRLGALLETQRQFNLTRDDLVRITDRARDAEDALAAVQQQGGTGLLEGEQQLHDLRAEQLRQLDALIERTRALTEANPDNGPLADGLRKLELEAIKLKAALDPTKLRLGAAADEVGSALADGLERAALNADSLKNILRDVGKQVEQIAFRELITKPIGVEISNTIKTGLGLTKTDPTSLRDRSVAERAAGLGSASKPADQAQQIAALGANTAALNALTAVIAGAPAPGSLTVDKSGVAADTGSFTRGDHDSTPVSDLAKSSDVARENVDGFGKAANNAQGALGLLSKVSGIGSGALSEIPAIIRSLATVVKGIGSIFGGGGGSQAVPGFTGAENFDVGGFTGNISPKEVAGVVHGGEFVFSAPAVRRLGVTALDTVHSRATRGFEVGGFVPLPGVAGLPIPDLEGFERGGFVPVPGFTGGGFVPALRSSAAAWSKGYSGEHSVSMPPPEWKVQVINNQSGVSEARTQQLDDGTLQIIIDAAATEAHQRVAADHASAAGPSSKALKSRGVSLGGGPRRF